MKISPSQRKHPLPRIVLACFTLVWLISNDVAIGQGTSLDQIWLQPPRRHIPAKQWYPRSIEVIQAEVAEFDSQRLRYLSPGAAAATSVAANRVIWIEPANRSNSELEVIAAFDRGDDQAMLLGLREVLESRPPIWRQQWLTMNASVAAYRSGRGDLALELIAQLDQRPLAPLLLASLPIAWNSRALNSASLDAAKARLAGDSKAARLVAASWLLSGPDRNGAKETLRQLVADKSRPMLQPLASCLLWSTASPPEVVQRETQWLATLQSMPLVLQLGPSVLLQSKLEMAGRSQAAAYLKLSNDLTPIHHRHWILQRP